MLKIRKKNQTSHVKPRNKSNDSFKRATDIAGQGCGAINHANQANSSISPIEWTQMHDSLKYQIEAEQKRALAIMYMRRNTFT